MFLWCYVRHINPAKIHPERVTRKDKKLVNNLKSLMELLLVIDENKSHCVYIKNFNRFMFHITKNKNKKILLQKLLTVF